ncbi:unnamed protein product [Prunus brigantina]
MICVSPNTCSDLANSIAAISGSPLTASLGKYLGVPLIHTRVNKQTYQEVIAKVHKRLASWKSHTLSMAGRMTLLQSVTAAIPIYTMQTAKLPMSVCSGDNVLFWTDRWLSRGPLYQYALIDLSEEMLQLNVGDFWRGSGTLTV